ncbi:MAG TPA: hypothetical protein PKA28_10700 [Methylomusa anaerophila]|uniref:Uncharacterized protein n=1 Tax=Methylomusa anaerophila TaxID=1930071 RepID=A0A348AIY5_9FIRM|nr:hypothetical protein [Methylomusa anaerophila]BBB91033.1 hypothetical protein MAMMFC1_01701 [Methylomusa anaerophila]HML88903.1 hypothetical protein [Methylomusa anaerophila]
MRKRKISKNLEVAKLLPPLKHSFEGKEFDIKNSEVMQWLTKRPEILNYVWNNIKNSGAVVFDSQAGKWQGIDYEPEE